MSIVDVYSSQTKASLKNELQWLCSEGYVWILRTPRRTLRKTSTTHEPCLNLCRSAWLQVDHSDRYQLRLLDDLIKQRWLTVNNNQYLVMTPVWFVCQLRCLPGENRYSHQDGARCHRHSRCRSNQGTH